MKNETIELHIIEEDYDIAGRFDDCFNCLLAQAAKRQFNRNRVIEGLVHISIAGKGYTHEYFGRAEYKEVTRTRKRFTITLTPVP